MFDKDNVLYGLVLGLVVPLVLFATLLLIYGFLAEIDAGSDEGFRPMFTERTTGIIAIAVNAFFLNTFFKRRKINSMRGIVIATFLLVAVWLRQFGRYLF